METSAKEAVNVEAAFSLAAKQALVGLHAEPVPSPIPSVADLNKRAADSAGANDTGGGCAC